MITRRLLETVAMTIIGDSMLCVVSPRRHISLWLSGPAWWQRTWRPFVRHPALTRTLGMLGLGIGLWLAMRVEREPAEDQYESVPRRPLIRVKEMVRP